MAVLEARFETLYLELYSLCFLLATELVYFFLNP